MYRFIVFLAVVVLMSGFAVGEAFGENFAGSLGSTEGELEGVGDWINAGSATIVWEITDMGTHYHYEYALSVLGKKAKDISHFIIEVSPTFGQDNFEEATGAFRSTEIGDFDDGNGNPDIPGELHGLKFDGTSGTTLTISFDSDREPVWGDFYAKGGGKPTNQVWNAGFSASDPTAAPSDGTVGNHILVPDSMSIDVLVPEPSTVALLVTGLLGLMVSISWRVRGP